MKKFIVEPEFWELFPETKIGIVLAKNIENSMESSAEIKKNLDLGRRRYRSGCGRRLLGLASLRAKWPAGGNYREQWPH